MKIHLLLDVNCIGFRVRKTNSRHPAVSHLYVCAVFMQISFHLAVLRVAFWLS